MEREVKKTLESMVEDIYNALGGGEVPEIRMSSRNRDNIVLDKLSSVWKYGDAKVSRSLRTTDGANYVLKNMYMIDFILEMLRDGKSSTLREMYYISEGWGRAKFGTQDESDLMAEDLEVITSLIREDFKLRPEENGASIIGDITIEERSRKGDFKKINCKDDVGEAGYTIPNNVESEKLRIRSTNAKFVLALETGGMFDRLVENGFDEKFGCVLVHLKGQPARSTRRVLKRMNIEMNLPIFVFTDGDPWSFRIFGSIAYGAIKTAHISEYLAVPTAEFIGVTASDILNYDLPTDKLTDKDIAALNAELKDPRFQTDFWRSEIETMLQINKKAEQQALAKYGLNYVTDTYLPEKLGEAGGIT
ncbi:MAG: DNA topoisomerase IV subunit A [Candidatus Thermoplasmatota archaeon]|jgi:DNA topoisomerase-6 subunit A|nr:DNA topoisomerase IV subunit A [Candidatus Thermoplasmatota archaeon]MCL5441668.1 DNA topoisomerase IV subunit A [Candidatus Thermoplasmatota archaeon]